MKTDEAIQHITALAEHVKKTNQQYIINCAGEKVWTKKQLLHDLDKLINIREGRDN